MGNTSLDFEGPLDSVEVGHHQAVNCQYEQEELFQVLNLPQSHNLDCHVTFVTDLFVVLVQNQINNWMDTLMKIVVPMLTNIDNILGEPTRQPTNQPGGRMSLRVGV